MLDPPFRFARVPLDASGPVAPAEQRLALSLGNERRQRELISGRLAARAALAALLGPLPADLVIARAPDGAPEILGLEPAPALSISHGHHAAVAAAAWLPALGIDLADHEDEPRVRRVAPRWLHSDEQALAAEVGTPAAWATLWALKESAAKALRAGLLDGGLRVTRLVSLDPPRFADPRLRTHVIPGATDVVAITWTV